MNSNAFKPFISESRMLNYAVDQDIGLVTFKFCLAKFKNSSSDLVVGLKLRVLGRVLAISPLVIISSMFNSTPPTTCNHYVTAMVDSKLSE